MISTDCRIKPFSGCFAAVLFILIAAAALAPSSTGQTTSTWTDGTGNWSNPLNWDNGVPNGNYNAVILSTSTPQTVTVDTNVFVR
jgi:hypothetical protein